MCSPLGMYARKTDLRYMRYCHQAACAAPALVNFATPVYKIHHPLPAVPAVICSRDVLSARSSRVLEMCSVLALAKVRGHRRITRVGTFVHKPCTAPGMLVICYILHKLIMRRSECCIFIQCVNTSDSSIQCLNASDSTVIVCHGVTPLVG